MSTSDGRLQSGNMADVYIRYSPYGTWKLQVAEHSGLQLETVTAIRFEFRLQAKPGRFDGHRVFFTGGTVGELGSEACGDDSGQSTTHPPPPPPTTTPAPTPTGGDGEGGTDAPCATYPELMAQSATVTAACCDDPAAPCSGTGTPSACSTACAAVLLPMQRACADFLVTIGMQAAIDSVVATCPAPAPAIPCTDFSEFGAASQTVTAPRTRPTQHRHLSTRLLLDFQPTKSFAIIAELQRVDSMAHVGGSD